MKITKLYMPDGVAGGGTTPAATPAPTPAPVTPATTPTTPAPTERPIDPGTAARQERERRDVMQNIFEPDKPVVPAVTPAAPAATTPPPASALTPQQIAQIAAETAGRMQPRPQAQAAPQFTQEEIDKQLGVVKVTPEMCTQLGLPVEAAPQLQAFAQAVVTNAVRMSNVLVEQAFAKMNNLVAPHISFAQQQQHAYLEHQFRESNPDLKGYEPIINDVAAKLKASGFRGTQKEAFDKIAEGTRAYLKTMNIVPAVASSNGATPASNGTVATPKPNMSTVSAGSQGGAGGAPGGSTGKKPGWADIWEK